jgi:membrane-associated protease RseP (regulator of RpoE activity)
MRNVSIFLSVCFLALTAWAQDVSRGEIFVGYSFLSADTNGLTTSRESVPYGINASFVANFNRWVGAETNEGTYYKKISGVDVYDYSLGFGPRVHYKPAFFHFLVGMDDLAGRGFGIRANQAGPTAVIGGGAILKLSRHIGVEGSADYALSHHNILGGPGVTQNNFRVAAGVVFTFGHTGPTPDSTPTPAPTRPTPRGVGAGMKIEGLGVSVGLGQTEGAEIVDLAPNGVAVLAGLNRGDVITSVDGKHVKTPMELAAVLSGVSAGSSVRLGYMIRGQWQSETTVIFGSR